METEQERIAGNVAKMRAQGATDAEVEHYLRNVEGLTPQPETPSVPAARPDATRVSPRADKGGDLQAILSGGQGRVLADEVAPTLAAHVLNAVPVPNAALAFAGMMGSKFTDNPMSYGESRAALDEKLGEIPEDMRGAEQWIGAPEAIPAVGKTVKALARSGPYLKIVAKRTPGVRNVMGMARDIQQARKASAPAQIAAPANTTEGLLSTIDNLREVPTAPTPSLRAPGGRIPIRVSRMPTAAEPLPPKVDGLLTDAIENMRAVPTENVIPIRSAGRRIPFRPSTTQAEEVAPTLEGLLGNSESVTEAGRFVTPRTLEDALGLTPESMGLTSAESRIGDVVRNASPIKQRGAPRARFDWFAEQQAARKASQAAPEVVESAEPTLEELLGLSTQQRAQGVPMQTLNETRARILGNRPR